jgi:hypothetical protein
MAGTAPAAFPRRRTFHRVLYDMARWQNLTQRDHLGLPGAAAARLGQAAFAKGRYRLVSTTWMKQDH